MRKNIKKFLLFFIILSLIILSYSCINPVFTEEFELNFENQYILILNSLSNNISIFNFNLQKFENININVIPESATNPAPNDFILVKDFIFIVNSYDNSISIFSKSLNYINKIKLPPNTNPYNICYDSLYNRIYITNLLGHSLTVINLNNLIPGSPETYKNSVIFIQLPDSVSPQGVSTTKNYIVISDVNYRDLYTFGETKIYLLNRENLNFIKSYQLENVINAQKIVGNENNDEIYLISTGNYKDIFGGIFKYNLSNLNPFLIEKYMIANDYLLNFYIYNNFVYITGVKSIYRFNKLNSINIEKIFEFQSDDKKYITSLIVFNNYLIFTSGTDDSLYLLNLNNHTIKRFIAGDWPLALILIP